MSEAMVVSSQGGGALQMGGVGLGSLMFRSKPQLLELVHKSSRQENVKYGEFRNISTNEHLGTKIRVVLLAVPQTQREWFRDPTVFTKENKACFSLDGIQPHPHAADPPALNCATCSKGDLNWNVWRKTKMAKDLPPCGAYYHLLLADRNTQAVYYLNVKGKSVQPFKNAMETQMSGLLAKLLANVRAENKKRGYTFVSSTNSFVLTPGFVLPEGQAQQPQEPLPSIYDISFDVFSHQKDGGPFQMGFNSFAYMKAEDRAEFGNLYAELSQQREEAHQQIVPNEEAEAAAAVSEAPATSKVSQEILPPITI